jgi:hypothetical protein
MSNELEIEIKNTIEMLDKFLHSNVDSSKLLNHLEDLYVSIIKNRVKENKGLH